MPASSGAQHAPHTPSHARVIGAPRFHLHRIDRGEPEIPPDVIILAVNRTRAMCVSRQRKIDIQAVHDKQTVVVVGVNVGLLQSQPH